MHTVSGIVEAPIERVVELLLNGDARLLLSANQSRKLVLRGGPDYFIATFGEHIDASSLKDSQDVAIDRVNNRFVIQGHWWYRGVYTIEPHKRGSLLVYRVYNVASYLRWAVPVMQSGLPSQMNEGMQQLLTAVSDRLQCAVHLQKN
jgi:hypothetical protein